MRASDGSRGDEIGQAGTGGAGVGHDAELGRGDELGSGRPGGTEPMAERAGFEPAVALDHTAFRERHLKPLGHLSSGGQSKPVAPKRRWRLLAPLLVAGVATALAGCGQQPSSAHPGITHGVAAAPRHLPGETVVIASGAESLTIAGGAGAGSIGGVQLGAGSGFHVEVGDQKLTVSAVGGQPQSRYLRIGLSPGRLWTLDLRGGVTSMALNLSSLSIAAIDVSAGANTMQIQLPAPRAVGVPVKVSGGATRITIEVPAGTPLRVTAGPGYPPLTIVETSGAGQPKPTVTVEVRGRDRVYQTSNYAVAAASYAISLSAGASSVRVVETG